MHSGCVVLLTACRTDCASTHAAACCLLSPTHCVPRWWHTMRRPNPSGAGDGSVPIHVGFAVNGAAATAEGETSAYAAPPRDQSGA
eukprot:6642890-Prymnesium_polylepis.2